MSFSLEIVPPSDPDKVSAYEEMLAGLADLQPDSVAVTLGAGQTATAMETSLATLARVQNQVGLPAVAHLTGLYETKASVNVFLERLKEINVRQIMALRGDYQPDRQVGDFLHASDLITYLKSQGDFQISAACYPAGHAEAESLAADLQYLQLKVVAGAQRLVSQVFFDNQIFYDFTDRAQIAGINVPIVAGVMPILSLHVVDILTTKMGLTLTPTLERLVAQYGDDPDAFRQAGLEFTQRQIKDLQDHHVAGIHLFTMNDLAATEVLRGLIDN